MPVAALKKGKIPKMPLPAKLPKTLLGIDMGYDSLKLALCRSGSVRKVVSAPMPNNLLREGRITSPQAMGEFIRQMVRQNGMRGASNAAVILSGETSYVRDVTMPLMSAEQLAINIPYEFNDYITDELKNYVFDYAMISTPEDMERERESATEEHSPTMELMLSAVQVGVLNDIKQVLSKAGLRLAKAAPSLCAYISLIRRAEQVRGVVEDANEYCLLDLGFQNIRMYMFRGDRHIVTRALDTGLSALDHAIADAFDVDSRLAHTYLLSNYNNCQGHEACVNIYNNLSVELMRALNFYRFSNPDSEIGDIWLCGGGSVIAPLQDAIRETLDMRIHQASELIPGGDAVPECYQYIEAIGITMD